MAIGPVIEDGFYYDIFSEYRFTPEDLIKIENRINKLIKQTMTLKFYKFLKKRQLKLLKKEMRLLN